MDWLICDEDDAATVAERNERAAVIRSIVGDLTEDDVLRLEGSTLAQMQTKLLAAGIGPRNVTQDERERLAAPVTHSGRGHASAPLIPGKKTRRQKIEATKIRHAKGYKKRSKHDPRKRWERA